MKLQQRQQRMTNRWFLLFDTWMLLATILFLVLPTGFKSSISIDTRKVRESQRFRPPLAHVSWVGILSDVVEFDELDEQPQEQDDVVCLSTIIHVAYNFRVIKHNNKFSHFYHQTIHTSRRAPPSFL